mmetsp:Transcript_16756/g.52385  ORF Transcript_16756/g.52385 Transcript_16756/m.52385 type:complete len:397 (+) Transcript_16756:210-1400(+)
MVMHLGPATSVQHGRQAKQRGAAEAGTHRRRHNYNEHRGRHGIASLVLGRGTQLNLQVTRCQRALVAAAAACKLTATHRWITAATTVILRHTAYRRAHGRRHAQAERRVVIVGKGLRRLAHGRVNATEVRSRAEARNGRAAGCDTARLGDALAVHLRKQRVTRHTFHPVAHDALFAAQPLANLRRNVATYSVPKGARALRRPRLVRLKDGAVVYRPRRAADIAGVHTLIVATHTVRVAQGGAEVGRDTLADIVLAAVLQGGVSRRLFNLLHGRLQPARGVERGSIALGRHGQQRLGRSVGRGPNARHLNRLLHIVERVAVVQALHRPNLRGRQLLNFERRLALTWLVGEVGSIAGAEPVKVAEGRVAQAAVRLVADRARLPRIVRRHINGQAGHVV